MSSVPAPRLTRVQWLICVIAAIGFAFDIYELLMLPLIVKPAIAALSNAAPADMALWTPGGKYFVQWARTLFFVPAIAGGVFGLLGGYLTDRLGRRRVLTWSILLYAFSACAAGFSTSLPQLLFFRCLVFIGVCVEFVAAVAWLAELFPNHTQREKVLGYTQAFSSFGGLLVAVMAKLAASLANQELLPAIHGAHEAWRYTLISGVIPAIPLIFIRPFLPESPEWAKKRDSGTLKRPNILELFQPALRKTTIITTLAFATTFGLAFGAIQQNPQILSGHADVKAAVGKAQVAAVEKAGGKPLTPKEQGQIRGNTTDGIVAGVQFYQEIGGMAGRVLLALLAVQIISRRKLFSMFQIPSLIFVPLLYWWLSNNLGTAGSLETFKWGIFLAGLLVVGQMSFWGNYIPLVFPVHLRGTGESFAANIGGRVLGTAAAWLTITFSEATPPDPGKIAIVGAIVAGSYALVGAILTMWLPEPKLENQD
ncbi:MAG: MFS transporter [Planctomycetaceae bacterium]